MAPRIGLIAVATDTGLGYQTRSYYKHLNPSKVIIIDISSLNGRQQHYDWYENAHLVKGIPNEAQLRHLLKDIDVLLTAETGYNLSIYAIARDMGVKTVCVENAEFFDGFKYPEYQLPDLIILPSVWKEQEIRDFAEPRGTKVIQLHHPVDRDEIKFRLRDTNKPMHVAGTPATYDRNGTWDYLRAYPTGLVTTQDDDLARHIRMRYPRGVVYTNIEDLNMMYSLGDILVLPRKYGGNCLVLNEALASGMPVIMTDIEPNNHLLPKEWLVPATTTQSFTPRGKVDIYDVDIPLLTEKIDWMRSQNIGQLSEQANQIADTISWDTLKDKWLKALEDICG